MSIEPYRTGHAGRPVRAITMEDRLRRYRVMQKLEPLTDEIIERHVAMMRRFNALRHGVRWLGCVNSV